MSVHKLLQLIHQNDETTSEAALTLGLLIEHQKVSRPNGDDGGISAVIGDEYSQQQLTEAEVETAVNGLLSYVNEASKPHPMAVWALTKSYDPRILPTLIALFERLVADSAQEQAAYQALVGMTSFYNQKTLVTIRKAAKADSDLIRETAKQYLSLFGSKATKD